MSRLFFSPSAREDLVAIFDHIAADNPAAAARFVGKLKQACTRIAEFPEMGALRNDLDPGVRCLPVHAYLVFYRPRDGGIDVVRILHASRDYVGLVD